jgi:hypothetical protein
VAFPPESARFRLRPRWSWLPWAIGGFGAALIAFAWIAAVPVRTRGVETATGLILGALAVLYARSPLWRSDVVVDEVGLKIAGPRGVRLALAWSEVVKVRAAPATKTCYIDAGMPAKSFLLPGPGAAAPYRVERREALYDRIVAACAGRVDEVPELDLTPPRRHKDPT